MGAAAGTVLLANADMYLHTTLPGYWSGGPWLGITLLHAVKGR